MNRRVLALVSICESGRTRRIEGGMWGHAVPRLREWGYRLTQHDINGIGSYLTIVAESSRRSETPSLNDLIMT